MKRNGVKRESIRSIHAFSQSRAKPKKFDPHASGGELSRTMLALKTILQTHDPSTVMIFDEVDTGISGRVAEMVGQKIRISGSSSKLCV